MEYQEKLQEGKLQDIATYQFFIFCCLISAFQSADIFCSIQNCLEEDFCRKNVFTPLTPTPWTADCSTWQKFIIDALWDEVLL